MSPRNTVEGARRTREAIVRQAVQVASVEGLEGLSFGRIAGDLRLSKAGVLGHFPAKEALQLAALDRANAVFRAHVWDPVADRPAGLDRLRAIADAWIAYLTDPPLPGGCFLTAASSEFDDRPGAVHDAIAEGLALWRRVLTAEARTAVEQGELPAGTDPDEVAFGLFGIALATNQAVQLHADGRAREHATALARRLLS